jgi:hypothetical protein
VRWCLAGGKLMMPTVGDVDVGEGNGLHCHPITLAEVDKLQGAATKTFKSQEKRMELKSGVKMLSKIDLMTTPVQQIFMLLGAGQRNRGQKRNEEIITKYNSTRSEGKIFLCGCVSVAFIPTNIEQGGIYTSTPSCLY